MRHNGWRGLLPEGDPAYVADAANLALLNTEGDDGDGCSVRCFGVVVEGGRRGSGTWIGATHQLWLQNTVTRDCGVALFASSGPVNYHDNHRDNGSTTLKQTQTGGQIIGLAGSVVP